MNTTAPITQCLLALAGYCTTFVLPAQDFKQLYPLPAGLITVQSDYGNYTKKSIPEYFKYTPPSAGKNQSKQQQKPERNLVISGGTRSAAPAAQKTVQLTLLSPNGMVPLTISAQPVLYWHLSTEVKLPVIFTLTEIDADRPLVEQRVAPSASEGFHSIFLSDYGVTLAVDKTYQWSITLADDSEDGLPSLDDLLQQAFLKRVAGQPIPLTAKSTSRNNTEIAKIYADKGYWYDSLATILGRHPNQIDDSALKASRSQLFLQAGLTDLSD